MSICRSPNPDLWAYLAPLVERYDAVVLSSPEYAQNLTTPQRFIMPAINPFSTTNKDLIRCRDCRSPCPLQHPYRPAARGAGFSLRQVERPARRD